MGVVFRGRDSRLQRDVALKLLPDHFASDQDRLSRFQREAQALASLNHANIAQIYGLEQVNGSTCIVMELVEGETLEDRLKKGPLAFDEAIDIARQIADALAVAHERGIVHRDLKPANIKLTPNGTVKVLDFGLAKALGPKASDSQLTALPTVASADRSLARLLELRDICHRNRPEARRWTPAPTSGRSAVSCTKCSRLARPLAGETITDILAKIVTSPPDLDLLPKNTPPSIRLLLTSVVEQERRAAASAYRRHPAVSGWHNCYCRFDGLSSTAPRGIRGKLAIAGLMVALAIVAVAVPALSLFS